MKREPPGILLNITQLSDETGRSRETVTRKIRAAEILPKGGTSNTPTYRLRDVLPALYTTSDDGGEKDPNLLEPHQRLSYFKAEESRLRLAVEAKQLIPVDEVESEMAAAFKLVAQTLETIPDLLERDCGLKPEQIETVEKHLDKLRVGLAERLAAGAPSIEDEIREMALNRPQELLALMKGSDADPFS